jgi:hypothetical protein
MLLLPKEQHPNMPESEVHGRSGKRIISMATVAGEKLVVMMDRNFSSKIWPVVLNINPRC